MSMNRLAGLKVEEPANCFPKDSEGASHEFADWRGRIRGERRIFAPRIPLVRIDLTAADWGKNEME